MSVLLKCEGQRSDPGHQASPARLEHPALRVRQAGEVGEGEIGQFPFEGIEAGLELGGRRVQGRSSLVGDLGLRRTRIAEESLLGRSVRSGPVGPQERLRFARGKRVAEDGFPQALLLGLPECR